MIVTCERCATQFQLDDARVPDEGVRVRCSRCKYAFQVMRPGMSEAQRIHRVARRALQEASGVPPGVTRDLPAKGRGGAGGVDDLDDEEESDWEFNDDRPSAAGDEAEGAGPGGGEDLLAHDAEGALDSDPYGFDTDAGADDDLDLASSDRGADAGLDLGGTDDQAPGGGAETADDPLAALGLSGGAERSDAAPDELGNPNDWDFFAVEGDTGAVAGEAAPADFGSTPQRVAISDDLVDDDEPGRLAVWQARAAGAAGWTVAWGLFVLGAWVGLAPAGLAPSPAAQPLEGIELSQVQGHWIDNLVAGPIYVVSGTVSAPAATRPLELELLDAQGKRLADARPVPLLAPLGAEVLREGDPRALRNAQGPYADRAPRGPFSAVVFPFPEGASSFRFAVARADTSEERAPASPQPEPEPHAAPEAPQNTPRAPQP